MGHASATLLSALAWLALASCATLASGASQEFSFRSSPEEAVVSLTKKVVDDEFEDKWHGESRVIGKTPLTIELDRGEDHFVTISKEGFKPVTMELKTRTDALFWGNVVLGGVIGSAVDALSGAMFEYSQNQFFVVLNSEAGNKIEDALLKNQRDKAREFIVIHYPNLVENLSRRAGEDVDSLLILLKVAPGQEADAKRKLRAISEVYGDPPDFADHAALLFLK